VTAYELVDSDVSASAAIAWSKLANVSSTSRILGRITAAAGVIEELTGTNVRTISGLAASDSPTFAGLTLSGLSVDGLVKATSGAISTTADIPSGVTIGTKTIARKFTVSLTGSYPKRVAHNLNTTSIIALIRDTATGEHGTTSIKVYDANNVDVDFVTAPADNAYELILVG
jgi:hypothetical protein